MNRCRWCVLVGGVALIVGALLPWENWACPDVGNAVRVFGYDREGLVSGVIGLLLAAMAVGRRGTPGARYSLIGVALAACASLIALDALYGTLTAITDAMADADAGIVASVGSGMYLTAVGAVVAQGGALGRVVSD